MAEDTEWRVEVTITGPGVAMSSAGTLDVLPARSVPSRQSMEAVATDAITRMYRNMAAASEAMVSTNDMLIARIKGVAAQPGTAEADADPTNPHAS